MDDWAEFYDLVEGDRSQIVSFYQNAMPRSVGSILELGCGTGTILAALAEQVSEERGSTRGVRIVGIDKSRKMLDIARSQNAACEFVQGDLRSPPVEGSFDFILCPYNTLQLCGPETDLLRTFRSVRRLLAPRGIFAFDIFQPNVEFLRIPQHDRLTRCITTAAGEELEIRKDAIYDEASNVCALSYRLRERGRETAPLARIDVLFYQFSAALVERLLEEAGLIICERFGAFDRSPFEADSEKQVVLCRRR
ncbi:MAG: class I SAM-dependent methyltransferase [Candidatus Baltobacteraceae bacterium]